MIAFSQPVARAFAILFTSCLLFSQGVHAHSADAPLEYSRPEISSSEYAVSETPAPIRMAYFSFVSGAVAWRVMPHEETGAGSTPGGEWSRASVNLPLRAGVEISVPAGARAELCFDDGSLVRLGAGAKLSIETMTAQSDSEFTALRLHVGVATLKLRHANSQFLVLADSLSIHAVGPATLRSGVLQSSAEVAVSTGRATIEGEPGTHQLRAGQFLKWSENATAFKLISPPAPDSFDAWNFERDEFWARGENDSPNDLQNDFLPANIALVAGNLERFGDWRQDGNLGRVWYPRGIDADWKPFRDGRWSWLYPFGWTWVADEIWGWAPSHYGTWSRTKWGWGWVPGPLNQPWSPAVVSFGEQNGETFWSPLAPSEVRYPRSLPLQNSNPNWANSFSIGGAASYQPAGNSFCEPELWNSGYVNDVPNVTYVIYQTNIRNYPDRSDHRNWRHHPINDWRDNDRDEHRERDRDDRRRDDKKPSMNEWAQWLKSRQKQNDEGNRAAAPGARPQADSKIAEQWRAEQERRARENQREENQRREQRVQAQSTPEPVHKESQANSREKFENAFKEQQEKQRQEKQRRESERREAEQRAKAGRENREREKNEREKIERERKEKTQNDQPKEEQPPHERDSNDAAQKIRRQFEENQARQEKEKAEREARRREEQARNEQENQAKAEREKDEREARQRERAERERIERENRDREKAEREQRQRENREREQKEREERQREREQNKEKDGNNGGDAPGEGQKKWRVPH